MFFMVSSDIRDGVQKIKPSEANSEPTCTALPHTAGQTELCQSEQAMSWRHLKRVEVLWRNKHMLGREPGSCC